MIAFFILIGIIVLAVIAQLIELRFFRLTTYTIESDKISTPLRIVVVADLHGFSYGMGNERLLKKIREVSPDLILMPGDLIVTKNVASYGRMASFGKMLSEIAPTYFSNGNHESRAKKKIPEFADFEKTLQINGILFLNNESSNLKINGNSLKLSGLELPLTYYEKRKEHHLPETLLDQLLGACDGSAFSILLAHNPAFGDDYFRWGADLTVSGHTHGGLVRFPGGRSLLSPELTFFPKYDGGHYIRDGKHLVVSKGLGTHTFHIRIFDRAEVVCLSLEPRS